MAPRDATVVYMHSLYITPLYHPSHPLKKSDETKRERAAIVYRYMHGTY